MPTVEKCAKKDKYLLKYTAKSKSIVSWKSSFLKTDLNVYIVSTIVYYVYKVNYIIISCDYYYICTLNLNARILSVKASFSTPN